MICMSCHLRIILCIVYHIREKRNHQSTPSQHKSAKAKDKKSRSNSGWQTLQSGIYRLINVVIIIIIKTLWKLVFNIDVYGHWFDQNVLHSAYTSTMHRRKIKILIFCKRFRIGFWVECIALTIQKPCKYTENLNAYVGMRAYMCSTVCGQFQ